MARPKNQSRIRRGKGIRMDSESYIKALALLYSLWSYLGQKERKARLHLTKEQDVTP